MDAQARAVRNPTYRRFATLGRAPAAPEIARDADLTIEEVESCWRELYRAHARGWPHRDALCRLS
jgi:hypothetical protein